MRTPRICSRKLWVFGGFLAILVATVVLVSPTLSVETLAHQERAFRQLLAVHPWRAFAIGLLSFTAISLVPGTRGKALIVGWLFGTWAGLVIVNFGLTLAALVAFSLSRYLLRDGLQERFGAYLHRVNRALEREGGLYVFAIRVLAVLPFSFVNYTMGATGIPFRTFWWSTQLGLLPGNFLFVYVGAGLPTLDHLSTKGWGVLLSPRVWSMFLGLAILPFAMRALLRTKGVRTLFSGHMQRGRVATGSSIKES